MIKNQSLVRIRSFFQDLVDFSFDTDLHDGVNEKFQNLKKILLIYIDELEGYLDDLNELNKLIEDLNEVRKVWLQDCVEIITDNDQEKKDRIQKKIEQYMEDLDNILEMGKKIKENRVIEVEKKRTELLSILEKLKERLGSGTQELDEEIEQINVLFTGLNDFQSKKVKEIENAISSTKDKFRELARRLTSGMEESVILELFLQQKEGINVRQLIDQALIENKSFTEDNLKQAAVGLWEKYLVEFYVQ